MSKDWEKIANQPTPEDESTDAPEPEQAQAAAATDDISADPRYQKLQSELAAAQQQATENHDKLLRLHADMENSKRRMEKTLNTARQYGASDLASNLLPVLDCLQEAIRAYDGHDSQSVQQGVELTCKMLNDALAKAHVSVIDPTGEKFDPEAHEAMSMAPSDTVAEGHVLEVFQKGYKMHDRILRPARVVVAQKNQDDPLEK